MFKKLLKLFVEELSTTDIIDGINISFYENVWGSEYDEIEFISISKNIQEYITLLERYSDYIKNEERILNPISITSSYRLNIKKFLMNSDGRYFDRPDKEMIKEFLLKSKEFLAQYSILETKDTSIGENGRNYRITSVLYTNVTIIVNKLKEIENVSKRINKRKRTSN